MHLGTNLVSQMTSNCDPGTPAALSGCLSMICGACRATNQGGEKRGDGSVCCHQFLHFKQTSGHRLHLQSLISSSDQTGADIHYKFSPPKAAEISAVCMHAIAATLRCISGNKARSQSETEAVISQQQQIKSSHSCGEDTCGPGLSERQTQPVTQHSQRQ